MKKMSRVEKAREIIARVKKEMEMPRLTESVRNGERRWAVKRPVAHSAEARAPEFEPGSIEAAS